MKQLPPRGRSAAIATAGFLIAATALPACGSSANTNSPPTASSSSTPSADAALLGADNRATGTPVKIGFAYDGQTTGFDTTNEKNAAVAVVKYANAKLGGLDGHVIDLDTCVTKGDPTTATACGNQFVKDGVLAVIGAELGEIAPVIKPVSAAGISYMDLSNVPSGLTTKGPEWIISNGLNAFAGQAVITKQKDIHSVAFISIDIPAATTAIKEIAPFIWGNVHSKVEVVSIPAGTADMTPQIQAEESKGVGQYAIEGSPSFCATALKAIRTLGSKAFVTATDACLDATAAKSVPGGFAGITIATTTDLSPTDPEFKLFEAISAVYSGGATSDSFYYRAAYQAVLGFIRTVDAGKLTATTPAAVITSVETAPPVNMPLGGGIMFQCNGKAIKLAPGYCSQGGITATAAADGTMHNFKVFNDPSLYQVPGAAK